MKSRAPRIAWASELLSRATLGDQPIGWPIAGTLETVEAMVRDDFVQHVATYYVPSNTVLSVAGIVSPTASWRLDQDWEARLTWNRVVSNYNRDADLFLCEATLADGAPDGPPRGHLSAAEAIAAHEASGAARLLLTHRPVELPHPEGVDEAFAGLSVEL